jgi:hypothetical protein
MPAYAWFSKTSANKDGTATYTRPNGSEVEVSFVAEGPDEFSVDPGVKLEHYPDLVFLGEVKKLIRAATELDQRDFGSPKDYVDPGDFE